MEVETLRTTPWRTTSLPMCGLESPLNTYTVADTANGESLADAAALHFDDDAFKILEPFAVSFNDLNVYAKNVSPISSLGRIRNEAALFRVL